MGANRSTSIVPAATPGPAPRGRPSRADPASVEPPASLLDAVTKVPGWLSRDEADLLYRLARLAPPGRVVELGSWKGRSTIALAAGVRDRSKRGARPVVAIDTFGGSPEHQPGAAYFDPSSWDATNQRVDTFPLFERHIAGFGLEDFVQPLRCDTADAAARFRDRVGLLFVDANHEYRGVRRDLIAWLPRLRIDALVALHDVGDWEGATRAAADLLAAGMRRIFQVGTVLVLSRRGAGRSPRLPSVVGEPAPSETHP